MYNLFPTFTPQLEGCQFQLLGTGVNFDESLSIWSYVRFAAEPNTYAWLSPHSKVIHTFSPMDCYCHNLLGFPSIKGNCGLGLAVYVGPLLHLLDQIVHVSI
jgi:hypothetical protein